MTMDEPYVLLLTYIHKLETNSVGNPIKFIENHPNTVNVNTCIGLSVTHQTESGLFYVDVDITCVSTTDDCNISLNIHLIYRGVAAINFSLGDDEINDILQVQIPQELYNSAKEIIQDISRNSGLFSLDLDDYSFKDNKILG